MIRATVTHSKRAGCGGGQRYYFRISGLYEYVAQAHAQCNIQFSVQRELTHFFFSYY